MTHNIVNNKQLQYPNYNFVHNHDKYEYKYEYKYSNSTPPHKLYQYNKYNSCI